MLPEYSTESFQCGRRCLTSRPVCDDLPKTGREGRSGNRKRDDLALDCQRQADVAPSVSAGSVNTGVFSNWIKDLALQIRFESDSENNVQLITAGFASLVGTLKF